MKMITFFYGVVSYNVVLNTKYHKVYEHQDDIKILALMQMYCIGK